MSAPVEPLRVRTLAVIGFGEVGHCFAAALAGRAASSPPLPAHGG